MGREIRRVPSGWKHPRNERGFIPMYGPFDDALARWEEEKLQWEAGTHRIQQKLGANAKKWKYEDEFQQPVLGDGPNPPRGSHSPFSASEATYYQVYEDETEGTPVSPVLSTLDEVIEWCVAQGYSRENAQAFVELGHVPSLTGAPGGYQKEIHGAARFKKTMDESDKERN